MGELKFIGKRVVNLIVMLLGVATLELKKMQKTAK